LEGAVESFAPCTLLTWRSGNHACLRVNRDKDNSSTSDALFRPFGSVPGLRRIDGLGQRNILRRSWCLPVHPTKRDKWDDGKRNQRAYSTCRLIKLSRLFVHT